MNDAATSSSAVSGEFIDLDGERYYAIRNVDRMEPFFVSVISGDDHWLFASSTGGLTAGRVSPRFALFPYVTVDKVHESSPHTGSKTVLRLNEGGQAHFWEPFNREQNRRYAVTRNLYKNLLGSKLCYEEINRDLELVFRCTWLTSEEYGFVRRCELLNLSGRERQVELLDGLLNVLPAGTPRFAQTNTSNLVDAYKWTEVDGDTGLALFTLYSGITDRAEPCESLKANAIFSLGLEDPVVLCSSDQLEAFRHGGNVEPELHKRGIRGAYLVATGLTLAPGARRQWEIVANLELSQSRVVDLRRQLGNPDAVGDAIAASVASCTDQLARIVASSDGFQATDEETVSTHHYANTLFNVLRGGIFANQYDVPAEDFRATIRAFNADTYRRNRAFLDGLPDRIAVARLIAAVEAREDAQLERLAREYLPITFGRRHGDPSRPWNDFEIRLKDEHDKDLLYYQGNWRDIFQNWEALLVSFPEFTESVIAKFVNASTADGYNPYRITKDGIDWEVEEPDDPWSYIGYWGDHQIIYLLKLLELSSHFHPAKLGDLLDRPVFCYANVPYRIHSFERLLQNPKSTVAYDEELAGVIEDRVTRIGADGKLVLDEHGEVYQVTLIEKLLVTLLSKLGNLVVDGGIWLNTQRPEWNDANNALVGQGLSMVTLYYMRRYIRFLLGLFAGRDGQVALSTEVALWLDETAAALARITPMLGNGPITPQQRHTALQELGTAASRYREAVYRQTPFTGSSGRTHADIATLLTDALAAIDHSIANNRRADGMYHAYNLVQFGEDSVEIDTLYTMLEGQVAALSAGTIAPDDAVKLVEQMFTSDIYRPDQHSFMLYPDRKLPAFLDKNQVPARDAEAIPLVRQLLERGDRRLIVRDAEGVYRFSADFRNVGDLAARLDEIAAEAGLHVDDAREPLRRLYEEVFNHRAFTGRSGGMFGFEGLGCIYWHMVAKLLLAIQESFFAALDDEASPATVQRLGQLYYDVRRGIGFNKTPQEYGAFPTDPYSHTPKHAGAQQPGMTGQVKEEILTRFGELGVRIEQGKVRFQPRLLRAREFRADPSSFDYLDVNGEWQNLDVPGGGLAFTWCQVPVVYKLDNGSKPSLSIARADGRTQTVDSLELSSEHVAEVFGRTGQIRLIAASISAGSLLQD